MRKNGNLLSRVSHPPQILSNVELRHKFRFAANNSAAGRYPITNNDILIACGGICTVANSTITGLFSAFKIHSVEVWGLAGASPATVSIDWNGTPVFLVNREVSDTSVTPTFPAYIKAIPPKGSNSAFWQTPSTETIFGVTVVNSSIIDLDVSLVLSDNEDVVTVTGVTTATLGSQYYLALDGDSSNQLVPVSMNTTH